MVIDDILQRFGLSYSDLNSAEKGTLDLWLEGVTKSVQSPEQVRNFVAQLRAGVEEELTREHDLPLTWLSLAALFIPFYGIVRKWYVDRHELELKARLRAYVMLEAFLTSPERARQQLEARIEALAKKKEL